MFSRIENLSEKKFIGIHMVMNMANPKTYHLWKNFMQRRNEIKNKIDNNLYSIQQYDPLYFLNFDINKEFVKWSAVEVSDFNAIPKDMEPYILKGGLYAIFIHKGSAQTGDITFSYIFQTWLPQSGYLLDNRAHFELLGEKYKHDHPDSEEEIWIPIKPNP